MTEQEAKTTTCHKTLAGVALTGHIRRELQPCIGSACMAWRWEGVGERYLDAEYAVPSRGYCGLAGKP